MVDTLSYGRTPNHTLRYTASGDYVKPEGELASVLVVDDEPSILRLVSAILMGLRCDVRTAPTAAAALSSLANDPPDLIISDIVLPDMDGRELVRHIKSDPKLSATPVILMSAYVNPTSLDHADRFIAKPFDIDEFSEIVQSYIRS